MTTYWIISFFIAMFACLLVQIAERVGKLKFVGEGKDKWEMYILTTVFSMAVGIFWPASIFFAILALIGFIVFKGTGKLADKLVGKFKKAE